MSAFTCVALRCTTIHDETPKILRTTYFVSFILQSLHICRPAGQREDAVLPYNKICRENRRYILMHRGATLRDTWKTCSCRAGQTPVSFSREWDPWTVCETSWRRGWSALSYQPSLTKAPHSRAGHAHCTTACLQGVQVKSILIFCLIFSILSIVSTKMRCQPHANEMT